MSEALTSINNKPIPQTFIDKIVHLRDLEITLGHLPANEWSMQELTRRINDPKYPEHASQMSRATEAVFSEVCHGLTAIQFSPAEIAAIINSHLRYSGGPKYCNESEVQEALEN
jgi:hypothetical protein